MFGNTARHLIFCIVCMTVTPHANAQPGITFRALEEADLPLDSLRVSLSLTPNEVYILMLINERYHVRFDSIRFSGDDRFKKFARPMHLRRDRDNELKFVLSDQQFRIYQLKQERQRGAVEDQTDHYNSLEKEKEQ